VPESRFGHYQIIAPIAAGAMGEVLLALDTRLDRKVALKFLPARFTTQPDRIRRFEQEARAASAINHVGILTIYEIGTIEDAHFIASEFVEGQTLRHRIIQGGMSLIEGLDVAVQIASALAAAHKNSIIHRDVKPENVVIRSDGVVKLLDFGLAKLTEYHPFIHPLAEAPTSGGSLTQPGAIVGTVNYMSPEQARGLEVDARTDIFSLGIVIYEMVTGHLPFTHDGDTPTDILATLLKTDPPPLTRFQPDIPHELDRIIRKALRKNRDERYQTIADLLVDVRDLKHELELAGKLGYVQTGEPRHPVQFQSNGRVAAATITAAMTDASQPGGSARAAGKPGVSEEFRRRFRLMAVVLVSGLLLWWSYQYLKDSPLLRRVPAPAAKVVPSTSFQGNEDKAVFSPDGRQIAFVWDGEQEDNLDIWVKLVDTGRPVRLTTDPGQDFDPDWSPDGRHIAFRRSSAQGSGIYLIPALGGSERRLDDAAPSQSGPGKSLRWSPDGKSLAIADATSLRGPFGIFLFSLDSGERRPLTVPPAGSRGDSTPVFSPDGKRLAFVRTGLGGTTSDLYTVAVAGGEPNRLTFDSTYINGVTWTPDGSELVFSSERGGSIPNLWRMRATGGEPERIVEVGPNAVSPSISPVGNRLAFTQLLLDTNIWRMELPVSASGKGARRPSLLIASTTQDDSPQYSPDGSRIAFSSRSSGSCELWVCDREGRSPVQLTWFGGPLPGSARWSPDGKEIAFDVRIKGNADIYVTDVDGGKPRRLTTDETEEITPSWSKDGQWLYFASNRSGTLQIWKMPISGGPPVPITKQGGFESAESKDGSVLYYTKERRVAGIWSVPTGGGEETRVFDLHKAGYWRYWTLHDEGIYFATAANPARPLVEFFNLATGKAREIATLEKPIMTGTAGLAVSPDGRWLLYTQIDLNGRDLMLVENFR
jgi:Tol biopolymer transport system component